MTKPWKLILLLVGIFLAGAATGVLLTVRFGRNWVMQRAAPEQWAPIHLRNLAKRLELTPTQVEQIRPIVQRNVEELSRLRNQSMSNGRMIMEHMQQEIAEKLTPGQRLQLEEYNREMREQLRKFMQKRPGRPSGPTGSHPEREEHRNGPPSSTPVGRPPEA